MNPMSNAERQRNYIARLKEAAATRERLRLTRFSLCAIIEAEKTGESLKSESVSLKEKLDKARVRYEDALRITETLIDFLEVK